MIKYKEALKNKKLSNFPELRESVINNGKKYYKEENKEKQKEENKQIWSY